MTELEQTHTIINSGGTELYVRLWLVTAPQGILIIAHGLGEHGGGYDHVAEAVREGARMNVVSFDFRGHGRSVGARGVVNKYEDFIDDLCAIILYVKKEFPGVKRFVLGHSNGGQVVLRASLMKLLDVDGIVLSNPALRLAKAVPRWKIGVGKLLRRYAPTVTLRSNVDLTTLTRDPKMIDWREVDPLRHGRINGALFFGLVEGAEVIRRDAASIKQPILLLIGGSDPIIDPKFTQEVFDTLGATDKTLWNDPDMLHEPLNELGREVPIGVLVDWLKGRV